jgi:general secretion pathway protein D
MWSRKKSLPGLLIMLIICLGVLVCQIRDASCGPSETLQEQEPAEMVSIDFNDVDINLFIKFISELTGKNFIVDRRVKGKISIISPSKISVQEAYMVFESVLNINGFSTVQAGRVIKILPSPDAKSQNIDTGVRKSGDIARDRLVTRIIPLRYADASEIKRLLTPLVSKGSIILSYNDTNTLIITDTLSNIERLLKIICAVDIMGIGKQISVIPVEHADASKLVKNLTGSLQVKWKQTGSSNWWHSWTKRFPGGMKKFGCIIWSMPMPRILPRCSRRFHRIKASRPKARNLLPLYPDRPESRRILPPTV